MPTTYTQTESGIKIERAVKRVHPKGSVKMIFFSYDGVKYEWTYNSNAHYGFIFICTAYGHEHIYSSTQSELNTPLGVQLELAISKMKKEFETIS